jgi:hypothetical protein
MSQEDLVRNVLGLLTHTAPVQAALAMARSRAPLGMAATAEAARPPVADPPWVLSDGITGFGVAEKEVCGKLLSDIVLKVYVEKKLPSRRVKRPVPKVLQLGNFASVETDVVEVGRIKPQSNTARIRPAIPGFSIGRAVDAREAGTFGLVVRKKGQTSPYYLLSNSHAIANSGFATKGDSILQPGRADGGKQTADAIGALSDWVPFVFSETGFPNLVDAAIAQLDDDVASAAIAQLGVPKGVNTTLTRGQYVQKMGRTTTLSVARVNDVDLRVPSTYPNPNVSGGKARVGFSDQVLVTFYSAGGDSGSPVLTMDNEVVGLHVAGSAIIGMFCKIQNIMDLLGIEVVTQQNVS